VGYNDDWPLRFGAGTPTETAPHGCLYFDKPGGYVEYIYDALVPGWRPVAAFPAGPGGALSVPSFKLPGDLDDTASIIRAEGARAPGQALFFPPVSYTLTGPGQIVATKPGKWLSWGATFNSNVEQIGIVTPDFTIEGGTFNYVSGDPAASLDRAIRIIGGADGPFNVAANIAIGDTKFIATSAAEAAALRPDDWVLIAAGPPGSWRSMDFVQVESVAGTTVNITSRFRRSMTSIAGVFVDSFPSHLFDRTVRDVRFIPGALATVPFVWYRLTRFTDNSGLIGVKLNCTSATIDTVGIDIQLARNTILKDCTIDVVLGLAFAHYLADGCLVDHCKVTRQNGRKSTFSSTVNSRLLNCTYEARDIPTDGFFLLETGGGFNQCSGNVVHNFSGGAGAFFNQWNDYNTLTDNTINGNGGGIGFYVFGGVGNYSQGNQYINCLEGARFLGDAANNVTSDYNTSQGDRFRKCGLCATIGQGTGNKVFDLLEDGTNAGLVQDAGVATVLDINRGLTTFVPTLSFNTTGDQVIAYSLQLGRFFSEGRYCEFYMCIGATLTYTTAAGTLLVSGLLAAAKNATGNENQIAPVAFSGWNLAGYTQCSTIFSPSDPRVYFQLDGPGKAPAVMGTNAIPSGTHVTIIVSGRYEINV
jgi:hypothetical protein